MNVKKIEAIAQEVTTKELKDNVVKILNKDR